MATIEDLLRRLEEIRTGAERRGDRQTADRAEQLGHQLVACVAVAREEGQTAEELLRRYQSLTQRAPSATGETLNDADVANSESGRSIIRYLRVSREVRTFFAGQGPC